MSFNTINILAQVVEVEGCRYGVCLHEEEANKDTVVRELMVKVLEKKLSKAGPRSLGGNRRYARFLKTERGALEIDYEAVKRDEWLDLLGSASEAFLAAGVKIPPRVQPIGTL